MEHETVLGNEMLMLGESGIKLGVVKQWTNRKKLWESDD